MQYVNIFLHFPSKVMDAYCKCVYFMIMYYIILCLELLLYFLIIISHSLIIYLVMMKSKPLQFPHKSSSQILEDPIEICTCVLEKR